jgi:hypothetical protein
LTESSPFFKWTFLTDNSTDVFAEQSESTPPIKRHTTLDAGLRNAYQWIAIVTMVLDHVGYLYGISALRYIGRFAMPIYVILFVTTMKAGRVNLKRLLVLAVLSQPPILYIFEDPKLNIIFGFAVFAYIAQAIEKRRWLAVAAGAVMMCIPIAYGWYLYVTLAVFYWLPNPWMQRGFFAAATGLYVYLTTTHPRQLLAILAPFIQGIRAPRPNKYIYRWFYPGHLYILAVLNYFIIGSLTAPFVYLRYSEPVLQIERFLQWLF